MEKPDRHQFSQVIKYIDIMYPKSKHLSLIMRKRQSQMEENHTKYLTNTLQKCQGNQRQGNLKNCHRLKETKKTWQLKEVWNSDLNHGTEKNIYLVEILG